ncbi:MAG: hypothetical protein WC850_02025 [Candidatus Gracilibacteria bacterium]
MDLQVNVNLCDELKASKEVIEKLVDENVSIKLDTYLNKFKKEDSIGVLKITINKNKKGLFDGNINASFDGETHRSEREDFKNLDDLINHLFDHIKEQLSDKK